MCYWTQTKLIILIAMVPACVSRDIFCAFELTDRQSFDPDAKTDTVESCWTAAVKAGADFMMISTMGCRLMSGQQREQLVPVPCDVINGQNSTSSSSSSSSSSSDSQQPSVGFVINVGESRFQLARLHADVQFWLTSTMPTGVEWIAPPGGITENYSENDHLAQCINTCRVDQHHYCLLNIDGCRCGRSRGHQLTIRHEDLVYLRRHQRRHRLLPAIVVKLVTANTSTWTCAAAPSSFVQFTAAQTMQEALDDCQQRDYQYIASGQEGFYCGNNTDNLQRFSTSQCEMKVTAQKSYSIISIKEIQRDVHYIEHSVREHIFWWVSEKSNAVFWTSLPEADSLEQCVLQCDKRFVSIGADGCCCGTMREDVKELQFREWVKRQPEGLVMGQGYLLLDKKGFVNVPEGWVCSTKPARSLSTGYITLEGCLRSCERAGSQMLSVGHGGCTCVDSTNGLEHLQMAVCQEAKAENGGYSLMHIPTWTNNANVYSSSREYSYHWISTKPAHVTWLSQPGNSVLSGCVQVCEKTAGVLLILLGVDGCECGIPEREEFSAPQWSRLEWTLASQEASPRGFFLVQRNSPAVGYVAPVFNWITKMNESLKHKLDEPAQPTWIRVNTTRASRASAAIKRRRAEQQSHSNYHEYQRGSGGGDSRRLVEGSHSQRSRENSVQRNMLRQQNSTAVELSDSAEREKHTSQTQKASSTRRNSENLDEKYKTYIEAGDNSIVVGKMSKTSVAALEEDRAKTQKEEYSKYSVSGEQVSNAVERITAGARSSRESVTRHRTGLLEKGVDANQTHVSAAVRSQDLTQFVERNESETKNETGTTKDFIHRVGGRCFRDYNSSGWLNVTGSTETGPQCMCVCVMNHQMAYAIFSRGVCACTNEDSTLGSMVGIVQGGACSDVEAGVVFDATKHAKLIITMCADQRDRNSSVQSPVVALARERISSGERTKHFRENSYQTTNKNASILLATHLKRQEDHTRENSIKVHSKIGSTRERWQSKFRKGLLKKNFRLRLELQREHNLKENILLKSRTNVQSFVQKRRPVIKEARDPPNHMSLNGRDQVNAQFSNNSNVEQLADIAARAEPLAAKA